MNLSLLYIRVSILKPEKDDYSLDAQEKSMTTGIAGGFRNPPK